MGTGSCEEIDLCRSFRVAHLIPLVGNMGTDEPFRSGGTLTRLLPVSPPLYFIKYVTFEAHSPGLFPEMTDLFKSLLKQPAWLIVVFLGSFFVVVPYVQIDKDNHFTTRAAPTTVVLIGVGVALIMFGLAICAYTLWKKHTDMAARGLDLSRVREKNEALSTTVGGCEIRVVEGVLEDFATEPNTAVVLPCNEYFDDECASDTKSSLGAYVCRAFEGRVDEFIALVKA